MPRIPKINPTLNTLSTQSVNAPQRQPRAIGETIGMVGETMSGVGEMFRRANLVAEKTKAQNDFDSRIRDIKNRAANETDLSQDNVNSYQDEINKAVTDSSQLITTPEDRGLFGLEAKGNADISMIEVNGMFMKKVVSQGKADLDIYLGNKKNEFIQANSASLKSKALLERDQKIKEMTEAGFLDPAEASKLKEEQTKDWSKSQVEYDIATNPEMARDILKEKAYPNIDEEDRVKLLSNANAAIRKNKKDAEDDLEINRINNESEYLTRLSTGDYDWMTVSDIAQDVRRGAVSEKFGLAWTDVVKSEGDYDPDLSPENENYPEFIENIYKAKNTKELNTALYNLLLDHKNMSKEKLGVLINGAVQRSKSLKLENSQVDPKQQDIDSGAMAVTNFGRRSNMSSNEIADIYQNYNKDIMEGKSVKEAYDNAIKTHAVSQYPAAATMEQVPNMIIDEDSPIKVIFPKKSSEKKKPAEKSKNGK